MQFNQTIVLLSLNLYIYVITLVCADSLIQLLSMHMLSKPAVPEHSTGNIYSIIFIRKILKTS